MLQAWRRAIFSCTILLTSACSVVVYQPLVGLQDPVVADLGLANLDGVSLALRCNMSQIDDLRALCLRAASFFAAQGAVVSFADDAIDAEASTAPDLTVELRGWQVDEDGSEGLRALSWATLNLLPLTRESTFVQEIDVHDRHGFLLASRRLEGRLVEHLSVEYLVMTWVLDSFVRGKEEEIGGDAVERDLSRDLYGQLCQTLVTARARQRAFVPSQGGT